MANFAKAQLMKYGWTEGKGLGKNENGIVDALKPKLKFDTTGVGHDSKEHKWWESVYNKAANNVQVETDASKVSVKVKDENAVNITTNKIDLEKLKKTHNLQYGSFLKSATLDNGKIVPDESVARSVLNDVVHETPSFELSDEQLFKACGGRTAHKGARHGLKCSGKLARIAQQEAELLGLPKRSLSESTDWQEVRIKSKRKRRRSATEMELESSMGDDSMPTDANANSLVSVNYSVPQAETPEARKKSKDSRRREKRRVQDLVHRFGSVALVEDSPKAENDTEKHKSKKKKKSSSDKTAVDKYSEKLAKKMEEKKSKTDETNENEKPKSSRTKYDMPEEKNISILEIHTKPTKRRRRSLAESAKANGRIVKVSSKLRKLLQKKKVEKLSESLMAFNIREDSVDSGRGEDLIESAEATEQIKQWKKQKKERKEGKIEEVSVQDS